MLSLENPFYNTQGLQCLTLKLQTERCLTLSLQPHDLPDCYELPKAHFRQSRSRLFLSFR